MQKKIIEQLPVRLQKSVSPLCFCLFYNCLTSFKGIQRMAYSSPSLYSCLWSFVREGELSSRIPRILLSHSFQFTARLVSRHKSEVSTATARYLVSLCLETCFISSPVLEVIPHCLTVETVQFWFFCTLCKS